MFLRMLAVFSVGLVTAGFVPRGEDLAVVASYYATGKITANGEAFDPQGMTAAHRKYKFGTLLRVKNLANGREVIVRVNDRGPYVDGRSIDLTIGAAEKLGMIEDGLAEVVVSEMQQRIPRSY